MLVSTALVLMILLIFATIYRSATGTVVQQRGIAQNDARARLLSKLLRSDLMNASFRDHQSSTSLGLLTLGIHDFEHPSIVDGTSQRGYVYISENDTDNDIDDVLQFTVEVGRNPRVTTQQSYVGKASGIGRPASASTGAGVYNPEAGTNPDQNQPEFDDGHNSNGAGESRYAEVCYFVRNGNLYRRVLLVREPLTHEPEYASDPDYYESNSGTFDPLIPGDYDTANADVSNTSQVFGDFWNDFDYAAYHTAPSSTNRIVFHGSDDLSNSPATGGRLSDPKNRFGFKYLSESPANSQQNGTPVEYVNGGADFIGRFTLQETSDEHFSWPSVFANSPFIQTDLTLVSGVVRDTSLGVTYQGPRRGEDLLLPNVDAFDIKVWDQAANSGSGSFVDIGHSLSTGYFRSVNRQNPNYGPRTPSGTIQNNIFDTWHPDNINYGRAPYRPLAAAVPGGTPGANGNWQADTVYNLGDRVFPFVVLDVGPDGRPGAAYVDDDMNGVVDDRGELGTASTDDTLAYYDGIYYEVTGVASGTSGQSGSTAPNFTKVFGATADDNELVWTAYDNRAGVPMIQITVRYRDPESGLSRQLTIQHAFTDGPRS